MGDHAVDRTTFFNIDAPVISRGFNQHLPGDCSALAHILMAASNTLAAARGETAPDAIASKALAGCGILGCDFCPVALEFLGDQLRQTGQRPLSHLGTGNAYHDGIVWLDHDPGVDLGSFSNFSLLSRQCGVVSLGDVHAKGKPGADRGAVNQKFTPRDVHAFLLHDVPARLLISAAR